MEKYSKHSDIEAVMVKAEDVLTKIESEYQKCLDKKTPPDSLLVEVKDCLANLRSALDYLWCKVPGAGSDAHFPIANSTADLIAKTAGTDQKFRIVLEGWQPYNGRNWTKNFGFLRNKNVHLTLIPQTRQEIKEFTVKAKTGEGSATFRGVAFNIGSEARLSIGGIPVKIDHVSQFPVDTPGLDIKRTIWVDFLFDASSISPVFPKDISVLRFLKESLVNVSQIVLEIESL